MGRAGKSLWDKSLPGLHDKFQTRQGCIVRPYLKDKEKKKLIYNVIKFYNLLVLLGLFLEITTERLVFSFICDLFLVFFNQWKK